MQKILQLLIAIGILYYLITSRYDQENKQIIDKAIEKPHQEHSKQTDKNQPITGNFLEKTLSTILVNVLKTEEGKMFFENILQPQNKQIINSDHGFKINNIHFINSMFNIDTTGEGTVGPASCGHIATIRYQIFTMQGVLVEEDIKTFTLGSKKIMPGIDSVVVGMMVGQTRTAVIPARYAFAEEQYRKNSLDNDASYKLTITLKEILPANFAKNEEVHIFDDEIAYKAPLLCGDYTEFNAKITKLSNGEVLFDTKSSDHKISLKIGDITYPMIFSHALYGKIPVGSRVVIAKGSTFYSFASSTSKIFPKNPLPHNEYFMLELTDFTEKN